MTMARSDTRRICGTNLLNSSGVHELVSGPSDPSTLLHEKLERKGWTMATKALPFLLENCHSLSFNDLASFWSDPTVCAYTRGEMALSAAGASWFKAIKYLTLEKIPEARVLALNGCFLYDCLHTPIEAIVEMCGENFSKPVSVDKFPCFTQRYHGIRTLNMLRSFLKDGLPSYYQNQIYCVRGSVSSALTYCEDQNMKYAGGISCDWTSSSMNNHQKPALKVSDDTQIQLILADGTNDGLGHSFNIGSSTTLKVLFNDYANKRGVSLRSLRFSHHGRTLFLSTVGNKTPGELNWGDRDIINVTDVSAPTQESNRGSSNQMNKALNSKKIRAKNSANKKGRRKKKSPMPQEKPMETLQESMTHHSRMITNLHEELQPRLKELRDRLNALGLERQPPKEKKRNKKKKKTKESADKHILPNPGTRGKAGKPYFIIQVGETDNLHKTKKSCHLHQPGTFTTLDLHGYTKNEALNTLNEKLPEWVDTAMRGDYPWVMPAQIICGCGSQILSEAVQEWIKSTRNVINAPKNFIQ